MNTEYQQESEQSRDYHRAESEFVKFMDKARHGMTTNDDVENAWKLLNLITGGPREPNR